MQTRYAVGNDNYPWIAPEILEGKSYRGQDVDIFAYGVLVLTSRMMYLPFKFAQSTDDAYDMLSGGNSKNFWSNFSNNGMPNEFIELCTLILQKDPVERMDMCDILVHRYITSSDRATNEELATFYEKVTNEAQKNTIPFGIDEDIIGVGIPDRRGTDPFEEIDIKNKNRYKPLPPKQDLQKLIELGRDPFDTIVYLYSKIYSLGASCVEISRNSWKLSFNMSFIEKK